MTTTEKSQIRTIEQKRAEFAFKKVGEVKKKNFSDKYKSHAKSLPMLIKTNGLGQTLAFIKSKDKAYENIYNHISEWIKEDPKQIINLDNNKGLLEELISENTDTYTYKAVTMEVLSFLNWLRRFVDSMIEDKKGEIGEAAG